MALVKHHTAKIIKWVLTRLYTLRNQIIQGSAIWNSNVNGSQLNDGVNLLGKLVPIIIKVMMDNPQVLVIVVHTKTFLQSNPSNIVDMKRVNFFSS